MSGCHGRRPDGVIIAQWRDGFQARGASAPHGPFIILFEQQGADEADADGGITFSDESSAIQAAIAGQGVALLYLLRCGPLLRMLPPKVFPPTTAVQHDFYAWRDRGLRSSINHAPLIGRGWLQEPSFSLRPQRVSARAARRRIPDTPR
jgi:DNA-binding transcriptional LysR family regulator